MTPWTWQINTPQYQLFTNIFSFIWTHVSYVCNFNTDNRKGGKKKSRLYGSIWVIFCIIGVHILNIIITRLQMNSNFTSCQKESNEFLVWGFYWEQEPRHPPQSAAPNFTQARMCLSPLMHFRFIQIIFTGLHFKLAQKERGKNPFAGNT